MRANNKVIFMIMLAAAFFAQSAFSVDSEKASPQNSPKPGDAVKKTKDSNVKKEPTKEDFIEHINHILSGDNELLGFIPELKKEKNASGNELYTYEGVRLDALDKEKLKKIYFRIQNEINRIRTERLNKQLESIRQADQASRQAQQIQRQNASIVMPPKLPVIPTPPPQPPATPPVAAQPPQAPPPQPESTRR